MNKQVLNKSRRHDTKAKTGSTAGSRELSLCLLGPKRLDHTHSRHKQWPASGPATDQGEFMEP